MSSFAARTQACCCRTVALFDEYSNRATDLSSEIESRNTHLKSNKALTFREWCEYVAVVAGETIKSVRIAGFFESSMSLKFEENYVRTISPEDDPVMMKQSLFTAKQFVLPGSFNSYFNSKLNRVDSSADPRFEVELGDAGSFASVVLVVGSVTWLVTLV